jgi:hypothetical protein
VGDHSAAARAQAGAPAQPEGGAGVTSALMPSLTMALVVVCLALFVTIALTQRARTPVLLKSGMLKARLWYVRQLKPVPDARFHLRPCAA